MTTARRAIAATIVATAALAAAACSTSPPVATGPLVPQAYGVPGQCYYIDDAAEALALIAAGLCQPGWAPTPMPLAWHATYYDYYASTAYMNAYVPRSYWVTYPKQQQTFYSNNTTIIIKDRASAIYKDSKGKTVPGSKINPAKATFGGGVAPKPNLGGGTNGGTGGIVPKPSAPKPSLGGGVKPVAPAPKPVVPKPPVAR